MTVATRGWMVAVGLVLAACGGDDVPMGTTTGATDSTVGTSMSSMSAASMTAATSEATDPTPETEGSTGSTDLPDEPFTNGSRLEAAYHDAGEGAIRFSTWVDTELGTDCTFAHDASWTLRCLPGELGSITYADAGCSQAMTGLASCYDDVAYVGESIRPKCSGELRRRRGWAVGAETTPPGTLYWRNADGDCEMFGMPDPDLTYREVTPVDDAMFLAATSTTDPVGDGLGVLVIEGDDGSTQRIEAYLEADDVTCFAQPLGDTLRCVPHTITYDFGIYHSEAACSAGGVSYGVHALECGDPTYALVYTQVSKGGCAGYDAAIHAVVGPQGATYRDEGTCEAVEPTPDQHYWEIGEMLSADALPAVEFALRGTGRVGVRTIATPSGESLADEFGFEDTVAGAACDVATTSDGLRCIASPYALLLDEGGYWADSTCDTTPLVDFGSGPCSTLGPPTSIVTVQDLGQCDQVYDGIFAVGATHSGDVYQGSGPGDCVMVTPSPDVSFVEVGTQLAFADFPAVPLVRPD